MTLKEVFRFISPVRLAEARGRNQSTSTRDKKSLLKKIEEIEEALEKLGYVVEVKNKKPD